MDTVNPIQIFPDPKKLAIAAAEDFMQRAIAAVKQNGVFTVVLSGGSTPKLLFDTLSEDSKFRENIPWSQIQFFFGDERYLPFGDSNTNYKMAFTHLFSKLPIPTENIHPIPTHFEDPQMAADEYTKTLSDIFHLSQDEYPKFDLIYLGLGEDGHTASLMPNIEIPPTSTLTAAIWVAKLNMYRITLTAATINHASTIIFLVTGHDKAEALQRVLDKDDDPKTYPAQLIKGINSKPNWYVDEAAAAKLHIIKAIFLDSDGVLNTAIIKDGKPTAPISLSELVIPTEVKPALDKLKSAGYLLLCITNKPDIERGLMTQADVDAIYTKMRQDLPLDDVFICYSEHLDCYKPKPGLLLAAQKKYHIDLKQSFIIGDRWRDIEAGQNADCKTIWIDRHYAEKKPNPPANYTAKSLMDAVDWILSGRKR